MRIPGFEIFFIITTIQVEVRFEGYFYKKIGWHHSIILRAARTLRNGCVTELKRNNR